MQKTKNNTHRTVSIWPFIKTILHPYRKRMLIGLIALVTVNLLLLSMPLLLARIIDTFSLYDPTADTVNSTFYSKTFITIGIFIGISILAFFLRVSWRYFLIIPSFSVERDIKNTLFQHILSLCQSAYQKIAIGEQISIVSRETQQLTQAISWGALTLADGIVNITSVYIILLVLYPHIAWPSLLIYPLTFGYVYLIFRSIGKSYERIQEKIAGISELTREMFENMGTIKVHNSEQFYQNRFLEQGKNIIATQMKISFLTSLLWPLLIIVNGSAVILALWFGSKALLSGTASIGDIFAVLSYLVQVEMPFFGLSFAFDLQQKGLSNAKRIKKSLALQSTLSMSSHPNTTPIIGAVSVSQLTFSYQNNTSTDDITNSEDSEHFTLGPLDLDIPTGTWVGIAGKIGSGKSTLAKLLARIYDSSNGTILWDGIDITAYDIPHIRTQVLLQPQDFQLFSVSIAQNILFRESTLNERDKEHAIQYGTYSAIHQDMPMFPEQWDTQIGEAGVLLSGGQRQRISLARTLHTDAPVLILDDVFSGLDNKTVRFVVDNLKKLRAKKTTFFISHNLPVISNADFILVMERGQIVERGTHNKLLNTKNSSYAHAWKEYLITQGKYLEE